MNTLKTVDAKTLKRWLDNEEAVLIDVREAGEYQTAAIPTARNLPLSEVTLDKAHLPEHRNKKLVLNCQSGRRSQMAGDKILSEDPSYQLYHLEGGILAWYQAGLPIIQLGKKVLPLDRQVQMVVGLMILTGLALGWWVTPYGFLLSVFMGGGLIMASLTGWCGLTHVLKVMPWNKGK